MTAYSNEQTLQFEITSLLPDLHQPPQERCIGRLVDVLQQHPEIRRAHLKQENGSCLLCLHYNAQRLAEAEVQRLARRASAQVSRRYRHETLNVEGMDCSDCTVVIDHSLGRMKGVLHVSTSYSEQTVRIGYDSEQIDRQAIERRLEHMGYAVALKGWRKIWNENREVLRAAASGVLFLIAWGSAAVGWLLPLATSVLYLASSVLSGWHIAQHAGRALRKRRFDTDLLMLAAALGAFAIGEFGEGALLLFLFNLGHTLEERLLQRAHQSIRSLADLTPKTARVRRDEGEIDTPVELIDLDEIVIVRPTARIPVDGIVIAGQSAVDQSPVTGESMPVEKAAGDKVFAGSVNGNGALEIRSTRLARDSTLARAAQLVAEAQASKSPTQKAGERFMRWFVPFVLLADVLLILLPPLFGIPFGVAFRRAMTLLVAASPCALALATPSAILAGVARAAQRGVLLKGGVHLENLGRLKALAFDKTGTITRGRPEVTDLISSNGWREDELLAWAAAVESRSSHPLAQALINAASQRGLALPPVSQAQSAPGRGIQALVEGRRVWVGSLKAFDEMEIPVTQELRRQARRLEAQGKTAMLVSVDEDIIGGFAVADMIRPEAREMVAALQRLGVVHTILLSGDNRHTAEAIARQAGISQTRAELMPEEKLAALKELEKEYGIVGMVGDGVNDAPALTGATVGIAMGGGGNDAALETADVVLMSDHLGGLPFAISLGQTTAAVIRQNLAIALSVIVLLTISSVMGWVGLGLAVLLHEGSTVAVALNSLRILRSNS